MICFPHTIPLSSAKLHTTKSFIQLEWCPIRLFLIQFVPSTFHPQTICRSPGQLPTQWKRSRLKWSMNVWKYRWCGGYRYNRQTCWNPRPLSNPHTWIFFLFMLISSLSMMNNILLQFHNSFQHFIVIERTLQNINVVNYDFKIIKCQRTTLQTTLRRNHI